jgi:hypothetical protein
MIWACTTCVNHIREILYICVFLGKHCHKGDCYFVGSPMMFSAATAYCKKSEYKVVKVSNEDEKEYVMKLLRESTTDNSFPQSHLGKWIFTNIDRYRGGWGGGH